MTRWQELNAEARKALEFDRDRVGSPGCPVRLRSAHLLQIMDEYDVYRRTLCMIGSMGLNHPECSAIAVDALKQRKWNGLCLTGKHGLDYAGQECDLCATPSKGTP